MSSSDTDTSSSSSSSSSSSDDEILEPGIVEFGADNSITGLFRKRRPKRRRLNPMYQLIREHIPFLEQCMVLRQFMHTLIELSPRIFKVMYADEPDRKSQFQRIIHNFPFSISDEDPDELDDMCHQISLIFNDLDEVYVNPEEEMDDDLPTGTIRKSDEFLAILALMKSFNHSEILFPNGNPTSRRYPNPDTLEFVDDEVGLDEYIRQTRNNFREICGTLRLYYNTYRYVFEQAYGEPIVQTRLRR